MRNTSFTLLGHSIVVTLRAPVGESMFDQVAVIDAEGFWEALYPLPRRLLLGWSIPEAHGGVTALPHGPWGRRKAHGPIDGPPVLKRSSVDRPRSDDSVGSAYHVAVRRTAISEKETFEPSRAHITVRIGLRALGRQLVQDCLREPEQHLVEHPALDALPAGQAIGASAFRIQNRAGMLQ